MIVLSRVFFFILLVGFLTGCVESGVPVSSAPTPTQGEAAAGRTPAASCAVTEPAWAKPPEDAAVQDPPAFGSYFVNADGSLWASAWWVGQDEIRLRASAEPIKVGWFRPAGEDLVITTRLVDSAEPPLEANMPCCYPTRFQPAGLLFPTSGCWEVSAKAAGKTLLFVVWVEP